MNILNTLAVGEKLDLSASSFIINTQNGFTNEQQNTFKLGSASIAPIILRDFLSNKTHGDIHEFVKHQPFYIDYDESCGRCSLYQHILFRNIHNQLSDVVSEIIQHNVIPSHTTLHMYDYKGVLPLQQNDNKCQVTLLYVIDQDEDWPLYLNGEEFTLRQNDAIVYSGNDTVQFRKEIPGSYHWSAVFQFIRENN